MSNQPQRRTTDTARAVGQIAGSLIGAGLRAASNAVQVVNRQPVQQSSIPATQQAQFAQPLGQLNPYATTATAPPAYDAGTPARAPSDGGARSASYGSAMSDQELAQKLQAEENVAASQQYPYQPQPTPPQYHQPGQGQGSGLPFVNPVTYPAQGAAQGGFPTGWAAGAEGFTQWSPISTTLGLTNGVRHTLQHAYANDLMPYHPPDRREDCCYWSFSMATTESLKHDLGCCFYFIGYLALRLLLAAVVMPIYASLMTVMAVLMIFPSIAYFYSSFCGADKLGFVAKFFFCLGFPLLAFASPATVCISAMWHGFFIPFEYCMMDSFKFMYAGPAAFLSKGLALRKQSYAQYKSLEYEMRVFAPVTLLLGVIYGMVFGALVFTVLAVLLAPKYLFMSLHKLWTKPISQPNATGRVEETNTNYDNDVCMQLCKCMWNSANDLCCACTALFRLVWSFVILLGVALFIPYSVVYGMWVCTVAGAGGWSDAGRIFSGPWAEMNAWLEKTKEQVKGETFGM